MPTFSRLKDCIVLLKTRFIRLPHAIILSLLFSPDLAFSAEKFGAFNFREWPDDIKNRIVEIAPEILQPTFTEAEIDQILRKVSEQMSFTKLSVVSLNSELYLVGSMNATIQIIDILGVSALGEEAAREVLSLSLADASVETKVTLQLEKLVSEYRRLGYRKTTVRYRYEPLQTGQRRLIVDVNEGPKTTVTEVETLGLPEDVSKRIKEALYWDFGGAAMTDDLIKSVNQKLRELLNSNGYFLTAVPQPQIRLSVSDIESRIVYNLNPTQPYVVLIEGEKKFSQSHLLQDVLKLSEYTSVEANIGAELLERLRVYYIENGFSEFTGTYFEAKVNGKIHVTLVLTEGLQTLISDISFQGNYSRPEKYYRDLFFDLAGALVQDNIYIKDDVELALKNFVTTLQNDGFLKARINRTSIQPIQNKKNSLSIVVALDEGPQLKIARLEIVGHKELSREDIISVLEFNSGFALGLTQLDLALVRLRRKYASLGHLEMRILNDLQNQALESNQRQPELMQYSSDLEQAFIQLKLYEGPRIRVGSISIVGNAITHNKLILTELDFGIGDVLTAEKIEESVSRLQKTGHFTSIDITTLEANTDQIERSVVVKVTEGKPGVVTFGVGVTNENDYTFHGYTGIAYRNLGGWGRGASLRAEGNYNPSQLRYLESKLTLGYVEPYLFETRARFRLNYTSSRFVSDVNLRKQTIANTATWSIEQDFTSNITGIWDIYNISNFVDAGITPEDEVKYSREDLVIASTGPTIDFDYRDNLLNPQSGSLSRLTLEYSSSALGNHKVDNFWRTTAQTTLYSPVLIRRGVPVFTWANSIRAGYLKDADNRTEGIPFDKRGFILGGRSTIRGFQSSEIFPTSDVLGANYRLLSSAHYQLVKSEFRYPLFPKQNIGVSLFYDGGQVLIENFQLPDPWRDTVGIGFHYNTPVGPLNLEYARKLDRKDGESEGAFHLSVGVF